VTSELESLRAALADRYALDRELGRGGMATVYLARDLRHGRSVAIKVLRPEIAAALGPERFLREIELAARLTHPHILPLHDSGEAAGFLFYVMPYIEGESLRDRLEREGPLPLEEALRITREVASALGYAHSHDVVHRDIKPENILLSGGEAVVADFGIARAITQAAGTRLTETGIPVGTPAYMSPEQASGGGPIDGRSDVYSLACVLYEMLVGEPPYTGPSAQVVIAKRFTDPVPSVRRLRDTIPPTMDAAITKALAKAPTDRFATAAQFGEALMPSVAPARPRRSARRLFVAGAVTAALGALVLTAVRWRADARPALDPNLVAVAPFEVLDPKLELWREGLVDILSRNLDGIGPLRTVSPSVVLHRWTGRADATSAAELGRRTGARLAVFGTLVRAGPDSVRLATALLDAGAGRILAEVDGREGGDRVDRLADSVTYSVLRALGRARPAGALPAGPLGSRSLPAVKAFLRGEQLYRSDSWDSAGAYYARAVGIDSTFGLAYRRLGFLGQWGWGPAGGSPLRYSHLAARFNHGLTPHDSLSITAESLFIALTVRAVAPPQVLVVARRLQIMLDQITDRYPEDPDGWGVRGETELHFGSYLGTTPAQSVASFDRAIARDSGATEYYEHPLQRSLLASDRAAARRYAMGFARFSAPGPERDGRQLVVSLLAATPLDSSQIDQLIDTVSSDVLIEAWRFLARWPDSTEIALRLARHLAGKRVGIGVPLNFYPLYTTAAYRGHLREAYALMASEAESARVNRVPLPPMMEYYLAEQAFAGAIPAHDATPLRIRLKLGFEPPAMLSWWGITRDTVHLTEALRAADSVLRVKPDWRFGAYLRASALANMALARADTAEALKRFLGLPDALCRNVCLADALVLVRLLEARRQLRAAAEQLSAEPPERDELQEGLLSEVFWILERARVNDRLGNRDQEIPAYRFVADVWSHADPELQPYVAEARAALKRLSAEPRP